MTDIYTGLHKITDDNADVIERFMVYPSGELHIDLNNRIIAPGNGGRMYYSNGIIVNNAGKLIVAIPDMISDGLMNQKIYGQHKISLDSFNNIWAYKIANGFADNIIKYDNYGNILHVYQNITGSTHSPCIVDMLIDNNYNIWISMIDLDISTWKGYIQRYSLSGTQLMSVETTSMMDLPNGVDSMLSLVLDKNNVVWVGWKHSGITKYQKVDLSGNFTNQISIPHNKILFDSSNNIIGIDSTQAHKYSSVNGSLLQSSDVISGFSTFYDFTIDKVNNVWVTHSKLMTKLSSDLSTIFTDKVIITNDNNGFILGNIISDQDNNIWVWGANYSVTPIDDHVTKEEFEEYKLSQYQIRGIRKNIFNNDYYVVHAGDGIYCCYAWKPVFPRNIDGTLSLVSEWQGTFTLTNTTPKSIMLLDDSKGIFTAIIDDVTKRYSSDFGRTWTT